MNSDSPERRLSPMWGYTAGVGFTGLAFLSVFLVQSCWPLLTFPLLGYILTYLFYDTETDPS